MEGPKAIDVDPTQIVSTSGSVSGAQALTEPGQGGATVLKMVAGGRKPTIVVDYGKDVGGFPTLSWARSPSRQCFAPLIARG